jgi:hypothetical protein
MVKCADALHDLAPVLVVIVPDFRAKSDLPSATTEDSERQGD